MEISEIHQRALRLSIAVLIACFIGYGVILPDEGIQAAHRKEFSTGLKWSAITCIVVNAPVIGRVAQTGTERILGTIVGGFLGFGVFSVGAIYWTPFSDGIVLSFAAAIVAFTSVTIGAAYGLENSTKLYALTFMLVTFGSDNLASTKGSLALTLTRIFGISFGVLLSEITCCLIFPKSATGAALSNLRKALKNLTDLNAMVWQHGPLSRPEWKGLAPDAFALGVESCLPLWAAAAEEDIWQKDAQERERFFEQQCEKALMESLSLLSKVQDLLPQARSEVYLGHVGQTLCFVPGVPWVQIGRRVLPEADIQELATCIRRVARLLWAVHLSFQQGFDANMLEMLRQQYPAQLMPELASQTQACLQDMLDAFPNAASLPGRHLHSLVSAVESLLRISDYQRRRILHHMKRFRSSRRGGRTEAPDRKRPTSPPQEIAKAQQAQKAVGSPRSRFAMVGSAPSAERAPSGQLAVRDYALGRSRSRRETFPTFFEDARSSAAATSEDGDLTAPLLQSQASSRANGSSSPDAQSALPKPEAAPFEPLSFTTSAAYTGSPREAFANLPEGLHIDVGSPADGPPHHAYVTDVGQEEAQQRVSVKLQRVESGDLLVFPETAEGYVDKVRWYSFQFLMEELTEEIEIMHHTIGVLLQKLPRPCLPL